MLTPVRLSIAALVLLHFRLFAQSDEPAIKARLVHKPLYLRGQWRSDKLHFTSAGQLIGDQATMSFTLGGIDIDTVKFKDGKLLLTGERVGLVFSGDVPRRVTLPKGVDRIEFINIEIDPAPDFTPALKAIFADSLADLTPDLPFYWQPYARVHFLAEPAPVLPARSPEPSQGFTAPLLISASEPSYSETAKSMGYSGRALVALTLGEQGKAIKASVSRPLGLGLDEQALRAALLFKFKPAMKNGQPCVVDINVDVNFQIH